MSDFLSNFSGENYEKTQQEKLSEKQVTKEHSKKKKTHSAPNEEKKQSVENVVIGPKNNTPTERKKEEQSEKVKQPAALKGLTNTDEAEPVIYSKKRKKKDKQEKQEKQTKTKESTQAVATETPISRRNPEEFIETDPTYKKRKLRKNLFISGGILIALGALFFIYYQSTHVKVPNFEGKELSEVRTWTAENGVKIKIEQKYDFNDAVNKVIHQNIKDKKIRKGNELIVEASLGPDPDEVLSLPDFKPLKIQDAKSWIDEHKASNLAIIEEYSDKIPAGSYSKIEIVNKDVKPESYKRKDKAKVYFSKGKEVYEKNIAMPDFSGKTKEEVVEWAKKNELTVKVDESDSETIEVGKVISQSIAKDTKVAKKEKFNINISIGKAIVVPNFSQFTVEEAEGKATGLTVQTKQVFHDTVPYGGFISQSVEAGKKYTEKDEKPTIQVIYSSGKPYVKDLRDTTLEGDLQRIFYEEYQSKGANITYQVYYVDSSVTKGTVVKMSKFNEFSPINYVVQIGISKGNLESEDKGTSEKEIKESEN